MAEASSPGRSRAGRLVSAWGALLLALGAFHHVQHHLPALVSATTRLEVGVRVVESLLMVVPAGTLLYAGRAVDRREHCRERTWLVLAWTVAGTVLVVGVIAALTVHRVVVGDSLSPSLLEMELLTGAGAGGVLGVLVGVSRATSADRSREVTRQRDGFRFLNRLLRHHVLNGAQVIDGAVGRLEGHCDDAAERDLETIRARSESITTLVSDVNTVIRTFTADSEPTAVNLGEVVTREVERSRREHPAATFETDVAEDVTVLADDVVAVVFESLLDNAVRHNDTDAPRVDVAVAEHDGTVRTTVADDGPGMPHPPAQFTEAGTVGDRGMGLYLVARLVEQFDGEFHLDANEPRGTVAVVDLPAAESATERPDPAKN